MTNRTRTTALIAVTLVACGAIAHLSASPSTNTPPIATDVKVTVKYTGNGTVDTTHRIWIWLFDTPDVGPGAMPIAEQSLETNGGVATFSSVAGDKVWIAVAYDERGGFSGSAPPPSGSPVMIHGMETGAPAPVAPGAKDAVSVTFNDAQRMP